MDDLKKRRIIAIFCAGILLVSVLFLTFSSIRYNGNNSIFGSTLSPFNKHNYLRGQWELYEGCWLISESGLHDEIPSPSFVELSQKLSGYVETPINKNSYRKVFTNIPAGKYICTIHDSDMDYRLFVNGHLISSNISGELGSDYGSYSALPFTLSANDKCEIVIEAYNQWGIAMCTAPCLFTSGAYVDHIESDTSISSILLGAVIGIGVLMNLLSWIINKFSHVSRPTFFMSLIFVAIAFLSSGSLRIFGLNIPALFQSNRLLLSNLTFILITVANIFAFHATQLLTQTKASKSEHILLYAFASVSSILFSLSAFRSVTPAMCFVLMLVYLSPNMLALYLLASKKTQHTKTVFLLISSFVLLSFSEVVGILTSIGIFHIPSVIIYLIGAVIFLLGIMIIYIIRNRQSQVNAQKVDILMKQNETIESTLMLKQIQPHFLYNCLATIQALVSVDPNKAEKALGQFAKYTRYLLNAMSSHVAMPFEDEMANVMSYYSLEEMRFGDKIKLVTDFTVVNFTLAPLSVQPLVENAIKHGLHPKISGGTVRIVTEDDESEYRVIVQDDGVGYDTQVEKSKGKFGCLENINNRMRMLVGGSISTTSIVGKGTTAILHIPKGGIVLENDNR